MSDFDVDCFVEDGMWKIIWTFVANVMLKQKDPNNPARLYFHSPYHPHRALGRLFQSKMIPVHGVTSGT